MNETNDAKSIIDAVAELSGATVVEGTETQAPFAILPNGKMIKSLRQLQDEALIFPRRKTGTSTLTSLEALCDFINRHKTANSIVFVDDLKPEFPRVLALFNAHPSEVEGQERGDDGRARADHEDHRALYAFPLSAEWVAWTKLDREMSQADFAEFLEDRIADVDDPGESVKAYAADIGASLANASRLLELSRGLSVTVDSKVGASVNLGTGERSITFSEEHKDQGGTPIKVPGAFAISIPVFRLGGRFQIPVRLRYRLFGGRVLWKLTPQRLDKVFELALDEAKQTIEKRCELPVYRGAP